MLSKLTGAAIHITFRIVCRVDSIVAEKCWLSEIYRKIFCCNVRMSAWPLQTDVAVQDARHNYMCQFRSLEAMRCKFRCMYFCHIVLYMCVKCLISPGGKASN